MQENTVNYEVVNPEIVEATPKKTNRFEQNGKDNAFKVIISLAGIMLTVFGIWGGFRLGFTVTAITMFTVLTVYLAGEKTKLSFFALICGLLNCLASLSFSITSNGGIRFLTVLSMMVLSAVWFVSLSTNINKKSDFTLISYIFVPFFQSFTVNLPKSVVSVFSARPKKRFAFGKALLGILLALPVLIIIVPLLMLSDAAFTGLVKTILTDNVFTVFKVIVGLIISFFIICYCFTLKKKEVYEAKAVELGGIDSTIVFSFLSVISLCYIAYLFSQIAYFFDGFTGILPEGYSFTYAEYARRGFFEMSIIAVINFVIISLVILFSKKNEGKLSAGLKAICTFISLFTIIIIATALSKMVLYIGSYGMTELRITTSAFMVFLGIVFLSLMLKLFFKRVRVMRAAIVTAACVLTILGTVNINFVISNYNYNAYKSGVLSEIDVDTIYRTGDEGVPYLVKLTTDKDDEVAEEAKQKLKKIIDSDKYYKTKAKTKTEELFSEKEYEIVDKKYDGIGEYNISLKEAYDALDKYIEKNPEVLIRKSIF